ncbi:MAG: Tm-1-like ATP-binding domain-containing protein [Clostridia bacterium]
MVPTILIIATLDTKEIEAEFLRKTIEENGFNTLVMDTGILSAPRRIRPDIPREEVAIAGGMTINELLATGNKGKCIEVMINGAKKVAQQQYAEGKFAGVIGIGGSQGTNIATAVMQNLPFGVPKLMVSTVACGTATFGPFVGTKDVAIMHSVVDVQGVNALTTRVFKNAAGAICGMVRSTINQSGQERHRKTVAMSMLGTTTPGALRAKALLEEKGFEVVAFHQNGTGGIAMEDLIREGFFTGVLDINLHELADRLVGGLHGAIRDYRLESASKAGLPQVIAPGSIEYSVQGPVSSLTPEMKRRRYIVHNPTLTLVRLSHDELSEVAKLLAEKINQARGPVKVFLPLKGFSYPNREGQELWDPEGNLVFLETFKNKIAPSIPVEEVNAHINDGQFIDLVVESFLEMMSQHDDVRIGRCER